jgi:hypothetical protein
MQTLWKLSQDGNSASRTLDNGSFESRLVSAIPADELASALPADLPTLAEVTAQQIQMLQASYQVAINTPVSFKNAAGVTSMYPSGNTMSLNGSSATQNLSNVIVSGLSTWTLGKWIDANNIAQTFTFADLQGLAAAMEAQEVIAWQNLEVKAAMVQSATTIAQVQAIIF